MRYKKKKVRIKWGRFLACILVLCVIIAALVFVPKLFKKPSGNTANNTNNSNNSANTANTANTNNSTPAKKTEVSIRIRCAGDILVHGGSDTNQLENALQPDGSYDFSHSFTFVSKWLSDADITLAQFETTFSGDGTYSGSPSNFDTPPELAKNVKDAGVDVAIFSNNHMLDSGLKGAINTVTYLNEVGFDAVIGARDDLSKTRSQVIEAADLKIGLVAFTYETPLLDGKRTLNGRYMEDNAPEYINSFRYEEGADGSFHINTEDLASIKSEIDWCRDQGAEIVICYFHRGRSAGVYGDEYSFEPPSYDIELIQFTAENGADVIFAGHPHVPQPIEKISVEVPYPEGMTGEGGKTIWTKTVPVFYSMGNFISNQRYDTLTKWYDFPEQISRRTEIGIIANVELTYTKETGEISYTDVSAIPTWVDLCHTGGKWLHRIIPLLDDLDANESLQISGNTQRAKNALTDITEFLGEKYIYKK